MMNKTITNLIDCPFCGKTAEVIRYTNWDNLETYFYLYCPHCNKSSKQTFQTIEQLYEQYKENKNEVV